MGEFIRHHSSGGSYSSWNYMDIHICAAKYVGHDNSSAVEKAANGIKSTCERLLSDNSISGYDIDIYDTDLEITDDDNVLDIWQDHRKNELGWTADGVWLLIHWDTTNGKARGNDAWTNDETAHASKYVIDKHNEETFKSVALHETLHCFSEPAECSKAQDQTGADDDHKLGQEYDRLYNPFPDVNEDFRSAMVGGWTSKMTKGDCSGDYGCSMKDLKPLITSCTSDSIKLSAEHEDGQH